MRATFCLMLLASGCLGAYQSAPEPEEARQSMADEGLVGGAGYGDDMDMEMAAAPPPPPAAKPAARAKESGLVAPTEEAEPEEPSAPGEGGDKADEGGQQVRSWFPEAFLWQPLVETDASGTATVDVRVPDTLTTWRVLALAHTRDGHQAGTVSTFDSRLPLYVQPVVPGWLYAGDRLELPVQVVNTTGDPVTARLDVSTAGALSGQGTTTVSLAAGGSDVRWVPLAATGAGGATVRATLGEADAAERSIPVTPSGRPVEEHRGGLLAGPRSFHLKGPSDADPTTQELAVLVFPGPLAVVQAEVDRAGGGIEPWQAAYGYALAAGLEGLANRTGTEVDPRALRKLRLLAWQRVIRHSRAPDAGVAADLLAGMQDVGDQELAQTLHDRLVRTVVSFQRGDGTWARQSSGSLQQVIVQTAFAVRTLPEEEKGARVRASGALERYAREVKDPYTAAVVLCSGVVEGDLAGEIRDVLLEGISESSDGTRSLGVPSGVVNPWGRAPTQAEVLAWASLALADQDDLPWRGDLLAPIMANYDATWGFGAGPADVIALEAVTTLLPGLDRAADVVLTLDGKEVARQALDPAQPKQPALLLGHPGGTNPEIGLRVEPEVPGLAFVATLGSWVPWKGDEGIAGVEVEVEAEPMQVGRDSTIVLRIAAPSGTSVTLEQGLPAGTTVEEGALTDGLVEREVHTDRVTLRTRSFRAGEVIEVPLVVRPAFAGSFETTPLTVEVGSRRASMPPLRWRVAREGAVASR